MAINHQVTSQSPLRDQSLRDQPGLDEPRLTVLQIIPRLQAGGAETGCIQIADALVQVGHRAIVVSEGGSRLHELEDVGAEHILMNASTKNPVKMWANARELAVIIGRNKVDIIHARSRAPAWSALWAAHMTSTRFVTTYHSGYSENGRLKNLYNSVMARSNRVIAVSEFMAHLIRTRNKIPEHRITVIHRCVDHAEFVRDETLQGRMHALRRDWGIGKDTRVLLLPGRVSRRKAQDHLIQASAKLKARGVENFTVVFAGDAAGKENYRVELDDLAHKLDVMDVLRFIGHCPDMPAAYATSTVSLNISYSEGFPRVALEAQAMATPVIVSDTGPGREVAKTSPDVDFSEATGLRVPYNDVNALTGMLEDLLTWPEEKRVAMGQRGADHVRGRYTHERLQAETLQVYREVMAEKAKV